MAHLRLTEHYEVPAEKVYELGIDVKRWPEWNPVYVEIKEVTGPLDKVGTRIHSLVKFLGRKFEQTAEIVEVEPLKLLKLTYTSVEGGKGTIVYRLLPVGTGCDLEVVEDYEPAGILEKFFDKLFIEKALERETRHAMENFKALVEAKVPVLA